MTRDGLITFVLPIKGTAEELGFVRNQLHSFDKFLALEGLREMLILCPSEDLQHVTTFVQAVQHSLPRLHQLSLRVVPEGLCAPELLPGSVYTPHFPRWPGAWLLSRSCLALDPIHSMILCTCLAAKAIPALNVKCPDILCIMDMTTPMTSLTRYKWQCQAKLWHPCSHSTALPCSIDTDRIHAKDCRS